MSIENFSVSYMLQGFHLMYPYIIGYFPTNRRPFKEAIRAKHFSARLMILVTNLNEKSSAMIMTEKGRGLVETSQQKARIAALMNKNVWSETLL
jgi:hypothetical protein